MTEEQAVEIIYEGLAGEASIPTKLRNREGLDRPMLASVINAIRFLAKLWKGRPSVPKRVAAAFVDLQSAMEWGRDQYSEQEQIEIEDAAIELVDLAWELFEEAPSS